MSESATGFAMRPAVVDDLTALAALAGQVQDLHVAAHPDLFAVAAPDDLVDYLNDCLGRDDFDILVASRDGLVVGYVLVQEIHRTANRFRKPEHTLYIHQIAVDRRLQRRGAGSTLMDAVLALAVERGCSAIRLASWAFNDDAHAFFARHGFATMNLVFENRLAR